MRGGVGEDEKEMGQVGPVIMWVLNSELHNWMWY
jgi:hypothetical protein